MKLFGLLLIILLINIELINNYDTSKHHKHRIKNNLNKNLN